MAKLAQFKELVADFASNVDFLTIYIDEAHPSDGWAFRNNPYVINNHTNIESRIQAAHILDKEGMPCPLVVDTMSNEASSSYAALPEKLVIIDTEGNVAYIGQQGPFGYKPEVIREWIELYLKDKKLN